MIDKATIQEYIEQEGERGCKEIAVGTAAHTLKVVREELARILGLSESDVYLELKIHRHPTNSLLAKAAENCGAMFHSREGSDWLSLHKGRTGFTIFLDPPEPGPDEV